MESRAQFREVGLESQRVHAKIEIDDHFLPFVLVHSLEDLLEQIPKGPKMRCRVNQKLSGQLLGRGVIRFDARALRLWLHLAGPTVSGPRLAGIGGLGGAIGQSIVYGPDPTAPFSPIRGLNTTGGWTQLKFQATPKVEFNGVFAEDDAFTRDIRGFATDENNFGELLGRNRGTLGNVIFRPRSDLVLSAEFRRYRTFPVYSSSSVSNQVNLSVGILF